LPGDFPIRMGLGAVLENASAAGSKAAEAAGFPAKTVAAPKGMDAEGRRWKPSG
jgi:hypothetical protein